jgi:hypothetical protein
MVIMSDAIIGELSIVASDGTELTAPNDLLLAWKWAPVEVDLNFGRGAWGRMAYAVQVEHVGEALLELRRAYRVTSGT